MTTGAFATEHLAEAELPALLARLEPAEILAPEEFARHPALLPQAERNRPCRLAAGRRAAGRGGLRRRPLEGFGSFSAGEVAAAAMALDYVKLTQAGALPRLSPPVPTGGRGFLQMDGATRRSLEILRSERGEARHSLLAAVDRTVTPAGGRELAARLASPLADGPAIAARHDAAAFLLAAEELRGQLARR